MVCCQCFLKADLSAQKRWKSLNVGDSALANRKSGCNKSQQHAKHPGISLFQKLILLGGYGLDLDDQTRLPPCTPPLSQRQDKDGTYAVCGGKGADKRAAENHPSSLATLHICLVQSKANIFISLKIPSYLLNFCKDHQTLVSGSAPQVLPVIYGTLHPMGKSSRDVSSYIYFCDACQ